ncbi:hypothetical protein D3C80_1343140 [compost metagenome]
MPAKRKHPLWLDSQHLHVPDQVLIARVSDLPLGTLARHETLATQCDAKPLAKGLGIGQGPPDFRAWNPEQDLSFDAI